MTESFNDKVEYLKKELGVEESFDVIHVPLRYAGLKMALFTIDGFNKDEILHYLMQNLSYLEEGVLDDHPLDKLLATYVPYIEIDKEKELDQLVENVLAGPTVLLVEGMDEAIVIDARTYPVRSLQEPDLERVVRGARDGYVETIVFNTALTRRRVRDRSLRMKYYQVGERSKTDICVCYLGSLVNDRTLKNVEDIIRSIDTDGLPMAEKTIEEYMSKYSWHPYPPIRYTERPDTAATHLYEGHILVMVDGSPSVIIAPSTFWQHLQHAEEYRQKPLIGSYLRLIRYIAVLVSLTILPLYYLFSAFPLYLPESFSFIGPKEEGTLPLIIQFLIAEVGIDMLRMAAIHTPSALATALGLVAAIIIGQMAIDVGFFTTEVVLYVAIAVIGTYATPSYEVSLANRIVRVTWLVAVALFGVKGFLVFGTLFVLMLASYKSFNVPYLWPILPFAPGDVRGMFLRMPAPSVKRRPSVLQVKDPYK
ncbi:spore germination protein [Salimicrobium halophilum]|uniref:Stage V sporulation protein AF n=1 Tax=Salimicrobium halophilum TaxID=86666 RepID=A0A1G8PSI7_9BACI|nr:spore germination protein [Salimicrobium halophilum]SDI95423.1 stage V sporulation protein AF [Salimicrobium halophilum]